MDKLLVLITELESNILNNEKSAPSISKVTVGWHLEHSLLVINKTIKALENSTSQDYKWGFSFPRLITYSLNKFPRGRGKAPKVVQPEGIIQGENFRKNIETAKDKVKGLSSLSANQNFKHPYFGLLNVKSTTKFLRLHTKHHLDIISDIVNAQ